MHAYQAADVFVLPSFHEGYGMTFAEAMAHGHYSRRVSAGGTGEIDRLAGAFNRMAEQVQEAADESALAVERLTKSMKTEEFLAELRN